MGCGGGDLCGGRRRGLGCTPVPRSISPRLSRGGLAARGDVRVANSGSGSDERPREGRPPQCDARPARCATSDRDSAAEGRNGSLLGRDAGRLPASGGFPRRLESVPADWRSSIPTMLARLMPARQGECGALRLRFFACVVFLIEVELLDARHECPSKQCRGAYGSQAER